MALPDRPTNDSKLNQDQPFSGVRNMSDGKVVRLFSNEANSNLTDTARAERELLQDVQSLLNFIDYIELEANKLGSSELALFIGVAQLSIAELAQDLRDRLSDNEPA
jgi:hypothetical protein